MKRRALVTISVVAVAFALAACGGNRSSAGSASRAEVSPAAVPSMNCNGEAPVWALGNLKVYLESGDRLYGKTKHGAYMCRSEAHAQGYQPARHPFRHHRHHRQGS